MGAQVLLQQGSGPEGSRQSIARGLVADVTRSLRGGMDGSRGPFGPGRRGGSHMVRRSLIPSVLAIVLAGCANASTGGSHGSAAPSPAVDQRRVGVYATLIDELAGAESAEWRRVYVVTSLCRDPAAPQESATAACDDVLTEAEQAALRGRLGPRVSDSSTTRRACTTTTGCRARPATSCSRSARSSSTTTSSGSGRATPAAASAAPVPPTCCSPTATSGRSWGSADPCGSHETVTIALNRGGRVTEHSL
jgi:hypothetical protein